VIAPRCNGAGPANLLAKSFAAGLKVTDAAAIACFKKGADTDPSLRGFVVTSYLARKVDLETAHQIVGLLSRCVDLPAFILRSGNVPVDATTKACLIRALNGSDADSRTTSPC